MKSLKINNAIVLFMVVITSFLCVACITTDFDRPVAYDFLFLLPATFVVCSIVFHSIYNLIPKNLGATIIIILFFVRMVLSPLLMRFGNYSGTIDLNINSNTLLAILMVCYENFVVFFVLFWLASKSKNTVNTSFALPINQKIKIKYKVVLLAMLTILIVCIVYTPELMLTYRTIFQINDVEFVNYEDALITSKYGTSFLSKLSLVTGQYLMRAAILIVPAIIIVTASIAKKRIWKWVSFPVVAIPLFFIGGAIARSLIYCLILLMLWNLLFNRNKFEKKIIILLLIGGTAVIAWWIFRSNVSGTSADWDSFSRRFSAYFSGVNVASGAFNMERTFDLRLRYFMYDFISTFPYGNTLFGISHDTIQPFFNSANNSQGQIPTTIGMGYYYFGFLLSPIYSIVFAIVAFKAGEKLMNKKTNPIRYVRLLLTVFLFSMGIIMYNIEITMIYFWTLILPIYLMENFAYTKNDTSKGVG